jgi:hypothetical protein
MTEIVFGQMPTIRSTLPERRGHYLNRGARGPIALRLTASRRVEFIALAECFYA